VKKAPVSRYSFFYLLVASDGLAIAKNSRNRYAASHILKAGPAASDAATFHNRATTSLSTHFSPHFILVQNKFSRAEQEIIPRRAGPREIA